MMTSCSLRESLAAVERDGHCSYGGTQLWADDPVIRKCGCGIIGALDLIIYLASYHPDCTAPSFDFRNRPVPIAQYNALAQRLSKRWLPLIYPTGINGILLSIGIGLFFTRQNFPYTVRWGVRYDMLWTTIAEMLEADIPVILSVGPSFPCFWKKDGVALYTRTRDVSCPTGLARAHYVTVTAMDERFLTISSWGDKYYIDKNEYTQYVAAHSGKLLSNIVYVRHK